MDVFAVRESLVEDYRAFTSGFVEPRDERIREHVQSRLDAGVQWPDPWLSLNPAFESGGSVADLAAEGLLHPECERIFRVKAHQDDPGTRTLTLHRHQRDAVEVARSGGSYVLTTGTGSGKSLAYIVPIVDAVLRVPRDPRTTLRRSVEWSPGSVAFADLPTEVATRLKSSATVVDLTDVAEAVAGLAGRDAVAPEAPSSVPIPAARLADVSAETLSELLVGADWLRELVALLRSRRQLVLYGPPGTGKTYLALAMAEAMTGAENVTLVQFHPAYSYEDFFEGYRPTGVGDSGQVRFELTPGPLRKVVDQARENPGTPYILIIDEINRANLARVFGELYFLLEYRDREIDLMYASGDPAAAGRGFSLPRNVYLIGTMNTADRSIALVDAAMRRRFAFLSLHPGDAHLAGVLRRWLAREGLATEAADLLDELNSRILDRDAHVGPSYLMTPDAGTEVGLARIWRTAILPLLVELHYGDDSVDVEARYGLPSLRRALAAQRKAEHAADETDAAAPADQ